MSKEAISVTPVAEMEAREVGSAEQTAGGITEQSRLLKKTEPSARGHRVAHYDVGSGQLLLLIHFRPLRSDIFPGLIPLLTPDELTE